MDQDDAGLVEAHPCCGQPVRAQHRGEHLAHAAPDELALLDDGDRVGLGDPRHQPVHPVALAARAEQDRAAPLDQERAVERRGLPGDELGPQVGEVANVLVLPDQQRVEAGRIALGLGSADAGAAEFPTVGPGLVADVELSLGETAHDICLRSSIVTEAGQSGLACLRALNRGALSRAPSSRQREATAWPTPEHLPGRRLVRRRRRRLLAPDFALRHTFTEQVRLADRLMHGPVVLAFYVFDFGHA